MPTIRQQAVLKKLPQNNFNLRKTMLDVGYSPSSAVGSPSRSAIRNYINGTYFDKEFIKKKAHKLLKVCEKEKDRTNAARMIEFMSKCEGMQVDRQEVTKTPDNIVINTSSKPSDDKDIQQGTKLT